MPEEYEKCLVGLTEILRKAWNTSYHTEDKREKIQALSLAKECYSMKLELLTNATVVDDAIRFVSQKSKPQGVRTDIGAKIRFLLQYNIWLSFKVFHPSMISVLVFRYRWSGCGGMYNKFDSIPPGFLSI